MQQYNEAGFTLIELVMVIVLLGILSVTAIPKFADVKSFSEKAFFDDTLNAVRFAQKLAVTGRCAVQVTITANAYTLKKYGISSATSCPTSGTSYALDVPHPSSGGSSYTGSESGITLTSTAASFVFYPLGNASADATLTVNGSRTITVVADTGFIYDSSP